MLSKSISSSPTLICFIFFFVFIVLVNLSFVGAQTLNYKISHCSNRTFAPNSTFKRNLNNLLSDLASHGSDSAGFFAGNASGEVYGLFLCRGDLPATTCQACVSSAAVNITVKCPGDKEAIIWYDECMLRISDKYAFSPAEISPAYPYANRENAADPEAFARELNETFADLVLNIDENRSDAGKMYAAREAGGGVGEQKQKLYGFAQCVPAMAVTDCRSCLRLAISLIPGCCGGKIGGKVRLPNCDIRFEIYKFFITRNATTTAPPAKTKKIKVVTIVGIVAPIVASVILLAVACRLAIQRRRKQVKSNKGDEENDYQEDDSHQTKDNGIATIESLQFDLSTIIAATDNFSDHNKLGEGGFGAVYKGTLCNGKEIAAKRLSSSSKQGVEEFRNEIELVAKLQHRNLVRLMGICFQGEEKILVYEFVPNRSLDYLIFDEEKSVQLDWSSRYKVIEGIARGLLYLHEDSRLRIVHRDLKASNVLLDEDMIPKISDFGLARIFGGDETQGNTCRIVGTHGYMSPEYIMYGHFSTKSDVFSFGILVLEIISGMHNRLSYQPGTGEGLLHCAWRYWTNRTPLELLDPSLRESCSIDELSRCIHIGLLCVQEDMEDRPSMASVLLMLNGSSVCQKLPRQPAFISQGMRQLSFPRSRDSGGHTSSESVPLALSDQVSEDHY